MNLPPPLIPTTLNTSLNNPQLFTLTQNQSNTLEGDALYIKCIKCNQIPFTLITSTNTVSLTCSCKRDNISIKNLFKIINNTLDDLSNIFDKETFERLRTIDVHSCISSNFIKCKTHSSHLNNIFCKLCQHYHCIKCINTIHNNNIHSFSTETYLNITSIPKHIVYEAEQRIVNATTTSEQPLPLYMQLLNKLITLFHMKQDNTFFINVIQNCKYSYTHPYLCEISTITINTHKQYSIDVIAFNKKYNHLISASSAVTSGEAVYIYQLHSLQYTSQLLQVISLNDINENTNTAVTAVFVDDTNYNLLIAKLSIHIWTFDTNVNKYIHTNEVNVHNNIVFQIIALIPRQQIASCSMDGSVALYNNDYEYEDVITPNDNESVNAIAYDNIRNVLYMSLPNCNEVYSVELKDNIENAQKILPEISSEFTNGFKLINDNMLGIARDNTVYLYDIIHQQLINEYKSEHDVNCILNLLTPQNNEVIYGCENGNIILPNANNTKPQVIQLFFPSNDNDSTNDDIHIVSICVLSNGILAFACGNGVIHLCTY